MNSLTSTGILVLAVITSLVPSTSLRKTPVSATPSRSFEFRYVVHVPSLPSSSRMVRIWVPLPYEDSYQSISGLRIDAPTPYEIRREPLYNDRSAFFTFDPARVKTPFDINVTFHATRLEHRIALRPVADSPARPADTTLFLRPDRLVPIDGQIADLSREQTQGVTDPLEKARKIYDYVIATMHYDHDGSGWGRGDAGWACNSKHGNCTDFHSLFIAMARAAGISARFEIGFPLPASAHDGAVASYHCWAEFYSDGIGWIPIDASEAWKNPAKKDYFFGATDANRVMFSLGRDIRLDPPQSGDPLNYFVYPYAEVDAKPFATLTNSISFHDDSATETPPSAASDTK